MRSFTWRSCRVNSKFIIKISPENVVDDNFVANIIKRRDNED